MTHFFQPWRRKLGVCTLLMASILATAWVRSLNVVDYVWQSTSTHTQELWLIDGVLYLVASHQLPGSNNSPAKKGWHWRSIRWREWEEAITLVEGATVWELSFGKLALGSKQDERIGWRRTYVSTPISLIALPLSLIAAGLLLSKPRPSKCQTPVESIPETIA